MKDFMRQALCAALISTLVLPSGANAEITPRGVYYYDPNTTEYLFDLWDRAEDVQDIQPVDQIKYPPGFIGLEWFYGVTAQKKDDPRIFVYFGEIGFNKHGYHPYLDTITREYILQKEILNITVGNTVYFVNIRSGNRPLLVQSADGTPPDLKMSEAKGNPGLDSQDNYIPVYQYTFSQSGRYEIMNALKPYQRLIINVEKVKPFLGSPGMENVSVIPQGSTNQSTQNQKASTSARAQKLKGRILLQVESKGEAWYVRPDNGMRVYLGRPSDAFELMRSLGLGITNADLARISTQNDNGAGDTAFAKKLAGKILLQVQAAGEAWYINPTNLKRYYLGRPNDAFVIMRNLGLGISSRDLESIPVF